MSAGALPGFRDFYPIELAQRNHLFSVWRTVCRQFGFVEYDGPPLEPLELYTKKSGEEIVGQLYNFEDKGGRQVALRPEMTPTFARLVAARANSLAKPVRWFSIPQLFRYERQQKGRLREHFQLNVDIVGEADVAADAELLAVAIEIMRSCALTEADVVARVSDRRLLTALLNASGVPDESHAAVFAVIDKIERDPRSILTERLEAAGLSAALANHLLDLVTRSSREELRVEFGGDAPVAEALDRLDGYFRLLEAHGVANWVKFDLAIVRGLAYYTGIVFELFDRQGDFRAICGGGRYDNLLRDLGGVDLPALGFGMGDVVLSALLQSREKLSTALDSSTFFVAAEDDVPMEARVALTTALRREGYSVEYAFRRTAIGKQRKAAWTSQVDYILELHQEGDALLVHVKDGPGAGLHEVASQRMTLGNALGNRAITVQELMERLESDSYAGLERHG